MLIVGSLFIRAGVRDSCLTSIEEASLLIWLIKLHNCAYAYFAQNGCPYANSYDILVNHFRG